MKAYFKKLLYLVASATVITTLSCGLDDRHEQPARTPEPPRPSEIPTPPAKKGPLFTVISRTNSEPEQVTTLNRTISKNEDYHSYKVDSPITLVSNMSDRLQFAIHSLPVHLKTRSQRLNASVTFGPKRPNSSAALEVSPETVSFEETADGLSITYFNIWGLKAVFGTTIISPEDRVYVKLSFSSSDSIEDKFSIDLQLRTPPSKLIFSQRSVSDFEGAVRSLPSELKYMEANNKKLNLIQVVEVQNLSEDPVRVDLPSQLKGKLWQRSLWMDPQYSSYSKLFCADHPQEIETIETYSTDFFLLPLVDELNSQWINLIQKETNSLLMLTREKQFYGVYASPTPLYEKDFKSLLKIRSPKEYSKANPVQTITVDTLCNFKCDSLNNTETFRKQCKRLPAGSDDLAKCDIRVTSCVKCITLLPEFHKQDSCNECFNHEYYDAPSVSKYGGHLVCSSGWRKESLRTKQGKRGTEMGSIFFEVPSAATYISVHYANLPQADDPEGRTIPLLRSNPIEQ